MQKKKLTPLQIAGHILHTMFLSILAVLMAVVLILANTLLPTYGRMVTEVLGYKQAWKTPAEGNNLDLEYNKADYSSADEIREAQQKLNEQIVGEGTVMLKGDTKHLPYAAGTKFSLFSHSSVAYLTGGYVASGITLKSALESRGFTVNDTLWDFYTIGNGKDYTRGTGSINFGAAEDFRLNECPIDVITSEPGLEDTFADTTAVFVLSRVVGEGRDMPRSMYNHTDILEDKTKNYLEPDSVELGIIDYLNKNFKDVVILINSPSVMETGWVEQYENIHTVLYTGLTGTYGLNSVADILAGNVNPSGHLVDTAAYDAFSSPAAQNYGSYYYFDEDGNITPYTYLDYAEGIYVGYKYYETRYEDAVMKNGNVGEYNYQETVQYPFGYGLSLTTFEWKDFTATWSGDTCTISVTVTNTGSTAGKDVVQVYAQSPYTEYDKENAVEKSSVELVGYTKTGLLEPGASETVTASFEKEQLKSYDANKAKTYILDEGNYYITAAADAHKAINNILAAKGYTVADGMTEDGNADFTAVYVQPKFDATTYATDTTTGTEITNQFDAARGDFTLLSRSDWTGTFPQHGGEASDVISTWGNEINGTDADGNPASYEYGKQASAEFLATLLERDSGNPTDPSTLTDTIVYGAQNGLGLIDLRGKSYDDLIWDDLLDQLTAEDYQTLISSSGYGTPELKSVGKPYCMDADSATGLVFGSATGLVFGSAGGTTFNGAEVTAQTWNRELALAFGNLLGNDALQGSGTVGWYCPATNIHRTPFSGRNNEYYSEDAFMSGSMASATVQEAAKKGLYTFVKHFALNDQENHRGDGGDGGVATWSGEQAIREIYLKPFEMCMKIDPVEMNYLEKQEDGSYQNATTTVPACNALMTSFNRLGVTWTGGHYNLITNVLRGEWGFNGFIITDANSHLGRMDARQMIEAGGSGSLRYLKDTQFIFDKDSISDYHYGREAAHSILYTIANSKAMNGAMPGSTLTGMATDKKFRILLTIVPALLLVFFVYRIFRVWKPSKRKLAKLEAKAAKKAAKQKQA